MKLRLDHTIITIARAKRKVIKNILKILAIIILMVLIFSGLALANKNRAVYGLQTAGIVIGGLSEEEIRDRIQTTVNIFLENKIILKYQEKKWEATPEELGIDIDIENSLVRIMEVGHKNNIFLNALQQFLALWKYYNVPLDYQLNEIKLENFIEKKLSSINNPAINASWKYNENINDFISIQSQTGIIIDQKKLKTQLREKIKYLSTKNEIRLELLPDYPEVVDNETNEGLEQAKQILANAPYQLIIKVSTNEESTKIPLTREDLILIIEFIPIEDKNNPNNKILGVSLNRNQLDSFLTILTPSINRSPVDAQLTVQGSRVTNFALSQDGLKLDINKSIIKIREEILNNQNLIEKNKEIELEISTDPPKITTEEINNLGITSLVGKGTSNFSGSPSSRVHNIKIGAAKFHGVLIKPNEEFSFNDILGEVGPEQGYKPELVIKKDKTVPEYGGGLCQVSTTAFRAAVYSGLPVTERYPHAFPVTYYNPQGFDATIYPPHPDLRFINNTPGYLLIQTKIEGYYLTFEFYGTDDGREVEVNGPYQYDHKPDGSMKTQLIQKVYQDGELITEKTFYSNYKSPSLYPIERNPLE